VDNNSNWEDAPTTNPITNLTSNRLSSIRTMCYKMKVWTDFRVRVRTEIRYNSSYIISL